MLRLKNIVKDYITGEETVHALKGISISMINLGRGISLVEDVVLGDVIRATSTTTRTRTETLLSREGLQKNIRTRIGMLTEIIPLVLYSKAITLSCTRMSFQM